MKYKEMVAFLTYLNTIQGSDLPAWNQAIGKLNDLIEALEPYEDPNEDGNYPPVTAEEYRRLEETFDDAVKFTNDFLKEPVGDNVQDNVRHQLTKNLNKEFLSKAYVEFKNVKPNPDKSLHESMESFRYQNVTLNSDDLRRLGGNLSSRTQLSIDLDGVNAKGVFTETTAFKPTERYENLLADFKLKYEKFSSFFASLNDETFYARKLTELGSHYFTNPSTGLLRDDDRETQQQTLERIESALEMDSFHDIAEEWEKYKNDPDFYHAMTDFCIQAEQFNNYVGVYEGNLHLQDGQIIDNRNCAMSSVANLLGAGDLLAKSKQLSVKMPDATFKTGTFMEFAEGKDITNLDAIDEMRLAGLDAYESPEAKIQMANLQIIDYICGNVDRHPGNILYQFDPETKKLTGIKGIDNDASFLRTPINWTTGSGQLASIRELGVIDKAMADKLLSIDEGMLSATLHGYGLSDAEINASWERLKSLQESIQSGVVFDPSKEFPKLPREEKSLIIVNGEDWDKVDINTLKQAGRRNIFNKVADVQKVATRESGVDFNKAMTAQNSSRTLKSMLSKDNTKDLLRRAKNDKPFMRTSSRYLNVIAALEDYQNEDVPENPLSENDHPEKWEKLRALKTAVENYRQEKIALGHLDNKGAKLRDFKGKDLRRIQDVEEIGKFADRLLQQRAEAKKDDQNLIAEQEKVRQANEFIAKPSAEQDALLRQKHEEEALRKLDVSQRLQQDLQHEDNQPVFEDSFESELNLSMDDAGISAD